MIRLRDVKSAFFPDGKLAGPADWPAASSPDYLVDHLAALPSLEADTAGSTVDPANRAFLPVVVRFWNRYHIVSGCASGDIGSDL